MKTELREAMLVKVQPLSVKLGELTLTQDEELLILSVSNSEVTFVRLVDNTQHTTSKKALEIVVE